MSVSAREGSGLDELWDSIVEHCRLLESTGALARSQSTRPPCMDASAAGTAPA